MSRAREAREVARLRREVAAKNLYVAQRAYEDALLAESEAIDGLLAATEAERPTEVLS